MLRCFQPDARTLVVRWSVSWDSVPGCDWAALEADAAAAQSAEERLASLCTSLVAARDQLLLAQRQAPSQPLGAALASLEAGLAEAERLRAAAAAATRALPRQWGLSPPPTDDYGSGFAPAAAPPGSAASAALAALRASLTLCVRGSTTLQLDGDGRLEAHTESLDFTPVTESAVEAAAGPFDNVVPFLMAHRGLGPAARWPGWDFACLRTALWLTFRFGGMADEEARLQLEDRDEARAGGGDAHRLGMSLLVFELPEKANDD